jgi:peptidoglycan/LPS O-acetylase OafA/YrhL
MGSAPTRRELPWCAAFLENYRIAVERVWPPVVGHFWSLAVEEQFYLVWPAILLFAPRRILVPLTLGAIFAAPACRFALFALTKIEATATTPTLCALDGLGLGALLALTRSRPSSLSAWLGLGLLAVVVEARHLGGAPAFQHIAEYLAFALIAYWLVGRASEGFGSHVGALLESRPLVSLERVMNFSAVGDVV